MSAVLCPRCGPETPQDAAALVNGRPIGMETLVSVARAGSNGPVDEPSKRRLHGQILEQLIEEELIVQEAGRLGIRVSEDELDQRIKEIKADYPGRAFDEMLIREYVDFKVWKKRIRRNLLVRKTTEAELKTRVVMDSSEWVEFFQAHRSFELRPGRVKVKHITTADRAQAELALKRIRAGRDFDRVTREVLGLGSEDELEDGRWVYPGQLPARISRAVSETGVGQVSEIVSSGKGFSIFKVLEIEKVPPPGPKETLARLQRLYQARLESRAYAQWIAELRARARIVINPAVASSSERAQHESGEVK